jgi:autotransporter strand-loop-strand O-heptosyltransferase
MENKKSKLFIHGCYIGTTGFNNHTRDFFRELSKTYQTKIRNFTVSKDWDGLKDEPFNNEKYLIPSDKILLDQQSYFNDKGELEDYPIYKNHQNNFDHNLNIILAEVNHHYFYQNYKGPKIGYSVWETTRYPDHFFNKIKEYDQIWVPSEWQKQCTIEQGIPEKKIKVVPEAVDSKIFHPDPTATLPEYDDGRFKFTIFGRWDYRKSTKELIESFLEEFDKDEPVDLIISIDNMFAKDNLESTEKRLKYYSLEDPRIKIKHFPTREEYIKYLQKGHVFLSCARSEGWNLPLIEAMACGTPSIYSDCSAQLEFAKGKGLPVKIKGTTPALGGEYSTYSQSDLPGDFYQPDYEDLKKVMRNAYVNYKKHKKRALKESIEIREKFTWANMVKIAEKEIDHLMDNLPPNKIEISFVNGPKVEVFGPHNESYKIEFIDGRTDKIIHSSTIKNGMWTKCYKSYYIPWVIKINGKIKHKLDLKDQIVKISLESKSIGDTLAWTPQVLEFATKNQCKVALSTFHNEWFKGLKEYKDIIFTKPGERFQAYAHYQIGWFKSKNNDWDNPNDHPTPPNTIPLIQTATDILGLSHISKNTGLNFKLKSRPIKDKYICIGPQSTAGLKEWPYQNWRKLAKILHAEGYKVVSLSLSGFKGTNIISKAKLPWEELFNYLHHADLFIGLGSGLSWVNWALNKHTVMINNFVPYGYDIPNNLTKIENHKVCNGCWVNKDYIFDPGDWDWCPVFQGTEKQHICQKSITVDQVYNKVLSVLDEQKK